MTYTEGIDVSHHEPRIDWQAVKNSGRTFVYTKATEGMIFLDMLYQKHIGGASAVGLAVGSYHFAHPAEDAKLQAKRFAAMCRPAGLDLAPWLDLEINQNVPAPKVLAWAEEFVTECEQRFGRRIGLYVGESFLHDFLGDPVSKVLGRCPLAVARYGNEPPRPAKGWPGGWTAWQYSDGIAGPYNAEVPGAGHVDKSKATSLDALRAR